MAVIHSEHDALLAWVRFLFTVQVCGVHHCELMYGAFSHKSLKSFFSEQGQENSEVLSWPLSATCNGQYRVLVSVESRGALGICDLLIVRDYKDRLGLLFFIHFILEHKKTARENWGHLGCLLGMGARQKKPHCVSNSLGASRPSQPWLLAPSAAMISTPSTFVLIRSAYESQGCVSGSVAPVK